MQLNKMWELGENMLNISFMEIMNSIFTLYLFNMKFDIFDYLRVEFFISSFF